MNRQLQPNNVSICHKENCIHASGRNATRISFAASILLILLGIAALSKS